MVRHGVAKCLPGGGQTFGWDALGTPDPKDTLVSVRHLMQRSLMFIQRFADDLARRHESYRV